MCHTVISSMDFSCVTFGLFSFAGGEQRENIITKKPKIKNPDVTTLKGLKNTPRDEEKERVAKKGR